MESCENDLSHRLSVVCEQILKDKSIDHEKISRLQRKKEGDFAEEVFKVNEEKDQLKKMKEELNDKEMKLSETSDKCLSALKLEISRKEKDLEISSSLLKMREEEVLNSHVTIVRNEIDRILSEVLSEAAKTLNEPREDMKIDLLDPRIILKWAEWNGVPRESAFEIYPEFRWAREESH